MKLPLWTVYKHPRDYPNNYVARLWDMDQPTETVIVAPDLESLHAELEGMHLFPMPRQEDDDPCIVEVWL